MVKSLDEVLDDMSRNPKKVSVAMKKAAEQVVARQIEIRDSFQTEEFQGILGIIREYDYIDDESLYYNLIVIDNLSEENFVKVVQSVFMNLKGKIVKDSDSYFPHHYVDYEGIRFHEMIGQGTAYWTEEISEN